MLSLGTNLKDSRHKRTRSPIFLKALVPNVDAGCGLQEDDELERERVALMLLESENIKRFQLIHEKASQ